MRAQPPSLQRNHPWIQLLPRVCFTVNLNRDTTNYHIAAVASRIQAQMQAKKGIQHVDVPPIRSAGSPAEVKPPTPSTAMETGTIGTVNGDMYIADGDYIRDIEVNDLRNRYTLTKGSTQKMVNTPLVSYPLISPVPSLRSHNLSPLGSFIFLSYLVWDLSSLLEAR